MKTACHLTVPFSLSHCHRSSTAVASSGSGGPARSDPSARTRILQLLDAHPHLAAEVALLVEQRARWKESERMERFEESLSRTASSALVQPCIGTVRCGIDWLLQPDRLAQLASVPHLRRLDLLAAAMESDEDEAEAEGISASSIRAALQSLQLESLRLSNLEEASCAPLLTACASSEGESPSLLAQWATTLTELQLSISIHTRSLLLQTLTELQWPSLRSFVIRLAAGRDEGDSAQTALLLQRAISPQRMPELQQLRCGHEFAKPPIHMPRASAFISSVWLPILPHLSTLNALDLSQAMFVRPLSALTLFQAVGAHNLPSLRVLNLGGELASSAAPSESQQVDALLRRMTQLDELSIITSFLGGRGDWLHSLHLLPSLRSLQVKHIWRPCRPTSVQIDVYLQSISAAPMLQRIDIKSAELVERLAQLWWRRMGEPPIDVSRLDGREWREMQERLSKFDTMAGSQAAASGDSSFSSSSAPALRDLTVPHWWGERSVVLSGCTLVYLAHLPHLRSLHCTLWPDDIAHLGLLPQLHSLVLRLHDPLHRRANGLPWSDGALRAIGDTRLLHLHTLRLDGEDAQAGGSSADTEAAEHLDLEFDEPASDETDSPGAAAADVSVDGGLCSLLRLPSLTSLAAPHVAKEEIDRLQSMASQAGQGQLHIQRTATPSHRSDLAHGSW